MSKFPSAYDVYNLSENFMATIEDNFRGTGDDNSLTNSKTIYIGSAPLERMIGLTAFIESYKINLQKEVKEDKAASSTTTYFTDVDGNLSINLVLNIPAHSTNEAVNNVAKIEDLQRLIKPGNWGLDGTFGSIANTNEPIMIVHFANLISNGRKVTSFEINSFTDLLQKGFPCYIENVSYDPEPAAGFFEFDSFLYPKNIKLTLDFKYESQKLINPNDPNRNKVTLHSFGFDGKFLEQKTIEPIPPGGTPNMMRMDDGMFPFHSDGIRHYNKPWKKMSITEMNSLALKSGGNNYGENEKHFLFIGDMAYEGYFDEKIDASLGNQDFLSNSSHYRYVVFESAVVSFARSLSMDTVVSDSEDVTVESSIHSELLKSTFKALEYPIRLDVVSSTLAEAYQNCAKIQYLMRLFIKKSWNPQDDVLVSDDLERSNLINVYMPSFIESGKGGKSVSTGLKTIVKNKSVSFNFTDLQVDIDVASGFYEDRGRMFPKKISLNMTFKTGNPNYLLGYNYNNIPSMAQWTLATPKVFEYVDVVPYDSTKPFLFPYNRKTVKIGGN